MGQDEQKPGSKASSVMEYRQSRRQSAAPDQEEEIMALEMLSGNVPDEEAVVNAETNDENEAAVKPAEDVEPPYCSFNEHEKRFLMVIASFAALISPFSSSIYYPAVDELSRDLGVSVSLINLTITTYLIFQGLAPSMTAAISETYGRRPAYLACFIVYLAANLGLALQHNYAALLVLRCVQSSGSSGTVALASGVVSDLSTRAERGKYNAYITMGSVLGPSLGPVVGGLLSEYLGWQSLFWFLLILAGVVGLVVLLEFRETNRMIVGNGTIKPPKWNRSVIQVIREKTPRDEPQTPDLSTLEKRKRRINPLASVFLLRERENFLIIMFVGIQYAGWISVTSILSSQLHLRYGLSQVDVGLCYLPLGVGSLVSRWTIGYAIDWNFKREAKKQGLVIIKNRQQDITEFDSERARLTVAFPLLLISAALLLGYGWAMEYHAPLAVIEVILFFFGNVNSGSFVTAGALLVDINRDRPASAAAAANLVRCLLGAAFVAVATPIIDAIGLGWTSTLVVAIWLVASPMLYVVYKYGHGWRRKKELARKAREEQSNANA